MRTAVLTSAEEVFALKPQWDELHSRTSAPVSMSFTWLSTWWDHFGSRFRMRTFAAWEGERLVGLFPCFIESFSALRLRASRMRFLGEYSILAEYHPLVDPECEAAFATAAAEFCIASLREGICDLIDVHAFPYDLCFMQQWIAAMKGHPVFMTVRDREVPRIRIDLPKTVGEYWARLSPNERHQFRKKGRIVRDAGARFECVTDAQDATAFQDYVRLSTSLWERKGTGSYFSVKDGFQGFQEEVTEAMMQRGEARLYFIEQGGRRFAALHAFLMNGVVQGYLGGRDPDHPLARHSPGLLLMIHVITHAIEEGFREFDFLTGNHPYKYHIGGTLHGWHGRVTVALRGPRGWKGSLIITSHNLAMAAGKSPRLRWVVERFDRLSQRSRGSVPHSDQKATPLPKDRGVE
jgi:CelD/BcsL family acetyltransferase involved in cellulose biosynthesis